MFCVFFFHRGSGLRGCSPLAAFPWLVMVWWRVVDGRQARWCVVWRVSECLGVVVVVVVVRMGACFFVPSFLSCRSVAFRGSLHRIAIASFTGPLTARPVQ